MMGEQTDVSLHPLKGEENKVLIMGGGIAGLTAALAIRRVAALTGLSLRPIIYEASNSPYPGENTSSHWILWRWAIDVLLELGLGKRLSRISMPIDNLKAVDADTNELLVHYPPIDPLTGLPEKEQIQDPEAGNTAGGIPAMIGIRKVDVIRTLLLALSDIRDDLLDGSFVPTAANNSQGSTPEGIPEGIDADLAWGNTWFHDEGYADLVPDLHLGYELDSFLISASTGKVTVKFTNGVVEQGFMLIGADGLHSKVRELLGSNRYPAQHAGAAVVYGIANLSHPPLDMPTEYADGNPLPQSKMSELTAFCPDGNAVGIVGRGVAFGVNNLGNGMLGWNLVVAQPEPHFHTTQFAAEEQERRQMGQASSSGTDPFRLEQISTDVPSSGPSSGHSSRSASPVPSVSSDKTAVDSITTSLQATSLDTPPTSAPTSPPTTPRTRKRMETAFERQLRLQREELLASKLAPPSPNDPVTRLSHIRAQGLALSLVSRHPSLPTTVLSLIAHSDAGSIYAQDILDLAQEYPESTTSPNFHPGRVILIGDAAHPVATNANGSVGGGLAITDAALLAKLIAKHLSNDHTSTETALGNLAREFDNLRIGPCSRVMTDARAEGGWGRTENGWVRSLWRLSWKVTTRQWVRSTFAQMLERGGIKGDYVGLNKVRTSGAV
ncbi:uncharacterized protein SPPG_02275 [Spizellomyces punctatus DAOM BR117]|uniref:FAD-binding domain-containing protein n=1 Tax=Spizellomyces punctatus (strain DAOM BR117) TaxID=645134 RepID=A0A0L0HQV8_SPIPD|nr:uncharacterized protein SPPG_02275 [Spizellomyces punctatus DAOM BR117]KND03219.1 hypothetical protein SPPG_02275 [Spizellomyces punctatus DAOM BR117]|eukprot:XP_016611258.1 hypothetical protein SPPG_02275 [Spizellomyces punctatus DAOM BR117]